MLLFIYEELVLHLSNFHSCWGEGSSCVQRNTFNRRWNLFLSIQVVDNNNKNITARQHLRKESFCQRRGSFLIKSWRWIAQESTQSKLYKKEPNKCQCFIVMWNTVLSVNQVSQVSREIFKGATRACRRKIREDKGQFELRMVTLVKDNKNYLYKYINDKRKGKISLCSLLDAGRNWVTADEEKAEVLYAFFGSAFSGKMTCLQENCPLGLVSGIREQIGPPIIQEAAVRELLRCLYVHKSMEADGVQPSVIRDLVDELPKLLSIIYQQSWLIGEMTGSWTMWHPFTKRIERRILVIIDQSAWPQYQVR